MNDIVAPIFSVYAGGLFNMNYLELNNNMVKIENEITEEKLMDVEADSYHCFSHFLVSMK